MPTQLGYRPRARFHAFALAGVDPVTMLTGPIPATAKVLERAKLTLDDIDLVEINEAFALGRARLGEGARAPTWPRSTSTAAPSRWATPSAPRGRKLMATLLNELERTGGRYGLHTMCEGGGLANATIIERL